MDRPGVRQAPEGREAQRKTEETGREVICGVSTTFAVKGLVKVKVKELIVLPQDLPSSLPSAQSRKPSRTTAMATHGSPIPTRLSLQVNWPRSHGYLTENKTNQMWGPFDTVLH